MGQEILVAGPHADPALASAALASILGDRGPLDVAGAADRDRHVLVGDQILDPQLTRVVHHLTAAIVAILGLHLAKLVDDDLQKQRLEILLDFVEERDFMARSELEQHVQKKVLETASRILIVDDEPEFRQLIVDALPFFAVIEAGNGHEALNAIEEKQPDLVITDIKMPEMDGLTATREIRANPNWRDLPIISLTAKATAQDQAQCIAAGANDYLAKPLDVDKLLSLVRVWMPR